MAAPTPKNEKRRLEVLWQHDLLDTVPEQIFDDLTELAGLVCDAPISLISLVDENRQWFKSKVGLAVSETPRSVSFCAHAITQEDLFIVPDATLDPRFAQSPLVVAEPNIRFYAGAPLVTPDGHALGTLCVLDRVPRELTPNQKQALRVLARHTMSQLELRRLSGLRLPKTNASGR
jgi:GAF domain-containing protein